MIKAGKVTSSRHNCRPIILAKLPSGASCLRPRAISRPPMPILYMAMAFVPARVSLSSSSDV
eukprot:12935652-Prorocentrum_lima.AAC.1